jgi:hypothetical protein
MRLWLRHQAWGMVDPMPVSWTVEPEGRFVVLVPIDPSTIEEWRTAMLEILQAPISRPRLTMLIDRRQSEPVSAAFVAQMTNFLAQHQKELSGSRRAILASDDAGFGMGRMTELMSQLENSDSMVRVFRTYDAAVEWLTGESESGPSL